jgi:hypothetical protein
MTNLFIIHTNPKQSAESYKKACQIANAHYDKTDEHIAVEQIGGDETTDGLNLISFPSDH